MSSRHNLRERKRADTRARMERASVDLVLRVGMQQATVEAICDAADVSTRTFFNYFESKDDAVLGPHVVSLSEAMIAARVPIVDEHGVAAALIGLILEIGRPAVEDASLHEARAEVLRRDPVLSSRQVARSTSMTNELIEAAKVLIAHDRRFRGSAASSLLAEPVLALCSSAVRVCAKEWILAGGGTPVAQVETRAIALACDVVARLSQPAC